jgi:hypothetical protein
MKPNKHSLFFACGTEVVWDTQNSVTGCCNGNALGIRFDFDHAVGYPS